MKGILLCIPALLVAASLPSVQAQQQPSAPMATLDLKQTIQRGQAAFQQGSFADAAVYFRQAAQLAPGNGRIRMALGLALLKANAFPQAQEALRDARRLLPADLEILLATVQVEIALQNFDAARGHAAEAARINPADLRLALLAVQIDALQGDFSRLRATLRAMARDFPQQQRLFHQIGLWLFSQRRPELDPLALSALLRGQRHGAADAEANLALASLQSMAGATADAIDNARRVMEQAGLSPERRAAAAAIAGRGYARLGRMEDAIHHLRMAIEWAPGVEHVLALAAVYRSNKEYPAAVDVLEQFRPRSADSPELLLELAANLLSGANPAAAAKVLTDVIARYPARDEAYVLLADAYRSTGDFSRVSHTLRALSARNPVYPMIHTLLARSLVEEGPGRFEEALAELAKAAQESPADAEVDILRGKVLNALGRYEEASEALARAVQLEPDSSSFRYQLGMVYQRLGKPELAKQQFEKMRHLNSTL